MSSMLQALVKAHVFANDHREHETFKEPPIPRPLTSLCVDLKGDPLAVAAVPAVNLPESRDPYSITFLVFHR
jgi:hypothetical protein